MHRQILLHQAPTVATVGAPHETAMRGEHHDGPGCSNGKAVNGSVGVREWLSNRAPAHAAVGAHKDAVGRRCPQPLGRSDVQGERLHAAYGQPGIMRLPAVHAIGASPETPCRNGVEDFFGGGDDQEAADRSGRQPFAGVQP